MKATILRMIQEMPPWSPSDDPKKVLNTYLCDLNVGEDGQQLREVFGAELKTMDPVLFKSFRPGLTVEVEAKPNHGSSEVFRCKDWGNKGGSGGKQGFSPSGSKGSGKNWQPRDYAAEERAKMPGFALSYAKDLVVSMNMSPALDKQMHGVDDVMKMADTLLNWLRKNAPKEVAKPTPAAEAAAPAETVQEKTTPVHPETIRLLEEFQKFDIHQNQLEQRKITGVKCADWKAEEHSILNYNLKRLQSGKVQAGFFSLEA